MRTSLSPSTSFEDNLSPDSQSHDPSCSVSSTSITGNVGSLIVLSCASLNVNVESVKVKAFEISSKTALMSPYVGYTGVVLPSASKTFT